MTGTGTFLDPYVIWDVNDLQDVEDDLTAYYKLGQDIDASATETWNAGKGFLPIGHAVGDFAGSFNGNGKKISDLHINRASSDVADNWDIALFATFENAVVYDFELVRPHIIGYSFVAALVGEEYGGSSVYDIVVTDAEVVLSGDALGTIAFCGVVAGGAWESSGSSSTWDNISASGTIAIAGDYGYYVGGLFGEVDEGLLSDCTADVDIDCPLGGYAIGGFVGWAGYVETYFTDCAASGDVVASAPVPWVPPWGLWGYNIGGFAGYVYSGGFFLRCHATGDVTGDALVGGFAGWMEEHDWPDWYPYCLNCYATGDVEGSWYAGNQIGGFIGAFYGGFIDECYATGDILVAEHPLPLTHPEEPYGVGGFVGEMYGPAEYKMDRISNCYARGSITQTGVAKSICGVGGFAGAVWDHSYVYKCYSTGAVEGDTHVGGFCGDYDPIGEVDVLIEDCYWDVDTSGILVSEGGTGKTTAEMKVVTTFPTWDFGTIWAIVSTCNDGYPCLLNTTPGCLVVAVTYAPAQSPDCENPWYGIVYAPSGGFVGSLQCWISLTLKHTVNAPTVGSLVLDGRDPIIQYLNLDSHVWIYRSNPLLGIKYYREAALFHRSPDQTWDERAQYSYTSALIGYEELLSRRILMGGADEAYCTGSYSAERAMKKIVETQCGIAGTRTLATTSRISGLSVSPSADRGQVWSGYQFDSSVLSYLQEIAEARSMALKVSSSTPAAFVFDAYPIPFGADRTTPVVANGRNAAGNIPVIFSEQRGNVSKIRYRHVRDQEGNVVLSRDSGYMKSTAAATDSPWNAREVAVSISADESADSAADFRLSSMAAREELELDIIQLPNCCYGKDYFLGDWVSVYVANLDRVFTKVITGVTIKLERNESQLDETVFVECGDRPLQYRDAIQESVVNLIKRVAKAESRISQLGG